jgi:Phage tail assembly chaperone protein
VSGEVTFFDLATGELLHLFSGPQSQLAGNTPPGCHFVPGRHLPASARVRAVTDDYGTAVFLVEPCEAAAPAVNLDAEAARMRAQRNDRLRDCDWVTLRAMRTGQPMPPEWAAYMQALADITAQPGFPLSVTWPTPPEA